MKDLLHDDLTLKILELLVSGKGVDANISQLAKQFDRHRHTIKDRVDGLYDHKIIRKPSYFFNGLLKELSLFVISKCEYGRDKKTRLFIENDPNIFAAYKFKDEAYNTITIQFHKNLNSYYTWLDQVHQEELVTHFENQHFPEALLFSTDRVLKFNLSSAIDILEKNFSNGTLTTMNDFKLDNLSFKILRAMVKGNYIRTNENFIAKELNIPRKTVTRKIRTLLESNIISYPRSLFHNVFSPPEFIVVLSLIETRKNHEEIMKILITDPHSTMLIRANQGRYDLFVISTFPSVEKYLEWQENLGISYSCKIGSIKNTFLSPKMAFSINYDKIFLEFIHNRI